METFKGKCPFNIKNKCSECVLYRKGLRYSDDPKIKPTPFEECAICIGVDCLENLVSRLIGNQRATEEVRNGVAGLTEFFFDLAGQKQLQHDRHDRTEKFIDAEEIK